MFKNDNAKNYDMMFIQAIAAIFCLFMLYNVFINFKKKQITKMDFLFWCVLWISVIFASLFPNMLDSLFEVLGIFRALDLFVIIAFLLVFSITYYMQKTLRKVEHRQKEIIADMAMKKSK